ncbi:hypothetical protein SNEBB_004633 [Seison nebaliae]|nr:hypothetical protein SNEBB_004633 [Seison nebaliae]
MNEESNYENGTTKKPLATLKICVIGNSSVGKSSLTSSFIRGSFDPNINATLGADLSVVKYDWRDEILALQLWDTSGTERFHSVIPSFYRSAVAVILVYDVTNVQSLQELRMWKREFDSYSTHENSIAMIVGNKVDLERSVARNAGEQMAQELKTLYSESSAKTMKNVKAVFDELIEKIMENESLWTKTKRKNITLDEKKNNNDSYYSYCSSC